MTLLNFNHIFSFTVVEHGNYLATSVCVCECVFRKELKLKADDRLIRSSWRLKEGRKWLSVHPTLSGWIPPVTAWRAPSIWRGA